jgi:hypothetical protein
VMAALVISFVTSALNMAHPFRAIVAHARRAGIKMPVYAAN